MQVPIVCRYGEYRFAKSLHIAHTGRLLIGDKNMMNIKYSAFWAILAILMMVGT